jgi:phenylacetate-CoA ligase
MSVVSKFIKRRPDFIKRAYYNFVPFGYRYGKVFRDTYKFLKKSQHWDTEELREYQLDELTRLLTHCHKQVPYYKNLFKKLDLHPLDIRSINDLKVIPILTKEIIRDNIDQLVDKDLNKSQLVKFNTSGSTGDKLKFYGTDDVFKKESAFVLRAFNSHGANMYTEPSIWLRRYVPTDGKTLWNYDYELKRLYMSAYHMNQNTVISYVEKINESQIKTLVGYPSSIYILACFIEDFDLRLPWVSAIHVASEKMLPEWKDKIESAIGIKVKAHYGQMEKVSFFYQTESSDNYTEALEYGVTEFEPDKETGEKAVIGTGFLNYAMPFIRYRLNDTATLLDSSKQTLGLPESVSDFNGRCDDILTAMDGSKIPGVNFYTMMYKIKGVKMFQIRQVKPDLVCADIVPDFGFFSTDTEEEVEKGLKQRLGDINIIIRFTDDINRSQKTGKIRCILNETQ